jgi:CheY-like chemotaxis protein
MARAPALGRVLIVDDEVDVLDVLTDIVGGLLGYDISTAINGAEALSILRISKPDVVLLDLALPVMSGQDVLRYIRDQHPRIPVIVVAAQVDPAVERDIVALGAFDYIAKPFNVAHIERVIAAATASRRAP